ncbi:MAG: type II toxin-antitoxin system RelE/ParE family toxin [Pirellulaceae bacterium]
MNRAYVLTRSAEADLQEIIRYTQREWGTGQCRAYIERLETSATELALGQGLFRQRDDLLPGLRVRLTGHHYIFCLPQTEGPAVILAVLYERMDLIRRLQERLD